MNENTDFQSDESSDFRGQVTHTYVACCAREREVPFSEATVREAADYVLYFCGLDCFDQWRSQVGDCSNPLDEAHC